MAQKKSRNPQDKAAAAAKREQRQARNDRAKALAEERRKAAKRREMLTRFGIVGGVLVVIVALVLVFTLREPKDDTAPAGASDDFGLVVGDADAPRSVVIYEDFLCPFCGQLEATVGDQLNELIDSGDVKVEYRPIPFLSGVSDYSPKAANALAVVLDASGPDVAKKFHDLLYANQPEESGPYPSTDDIVDLAVEAGAKESDVRPGIEDDAFEGWVDAAGDASQDADVSSTPTVIVDGQRIEGANLTITDIADAIVGSGS